MFLEVEVDFGGALFEGRFCSADETVVEVTGETLKKFWIETRT